MIQVGSLHTSIMSYQEAVTNVVITSPLLRVNTIQQTGVGRFSQSKNIANKIVKEEGILGLWKGTEIAVCNALASLALEKTVTKKSEILEKSDHWKKIPPFWRKVIKIGIEAIIVTIVTHPLEVIQTKLFTHYGRLGKDYNLLHCIKDTWRIDGISGFFSGLGASLIGNVIGRILYYTGLDYLNSRVKTKELWKRWLLTQLHTSVTFLLVYPFETISKTAIVNRAYTSCLKTACGVFDLEGFSGFYKGCQIRLVAILMAPLGVLSMDWVKKKIVSEKRKLM